MMTRRERFKALWSGLDEWFRPGRCILCGRTGLVLFDSEHEECWLASK